MFLRACLCVILCIFCLFSTNASFANSYYSTADLSEIIENNFNIDPLNILNVPVTYNFYEDDVFIIHSIDQGNLSLQYWQLAIPLSQSKVFKFFNAEHNVSAIAKISESGLGSLSYQDQVKNDYLLISQPNIHSAEGSWSINELSGVFSATQNNKQADLMARWNKDIANTKNDTHLFFQSDNQSAQGSWMSPANNGALKISRINNQSELTARWNNGILYYADWIENNRRGYYSDYSKNGVQTAEIWVGNKELYIGDRTNNNDDFVYLNHSGPEYEGHWSVGSADGEYYATQTQNLWEIYARAKNKNLYYGESIDNGQKSYYADINEDGEQLTEIWTNSNEFWFQNKHNNETNHVWLDLKGPYYEGDWNFNHNSGSFTANQANNIFNFNGNWNGSNLSLVYDSTGAQSLTNVQLTKANGNVLQLNDNDIIKMRNGNLNPLMDLIDQEPHIVLSFDKVFDANNRISFSQPTRTLSASFQQHDVILNLGTDPFLQYDSALRDLHLKVSPRRHGINILEGTYANDMLSVNLNNTYLTFNAKSTLLGLYSDTSYLIKVATSDKSILAGEIETLAQSLIKSNAIDSTDTLIRKHVKKVSLNFREISKRDVISFSEPGWNSLLTALAWDVPEGSLSGDDVANIVSSKDSDNEIYTLLSNMLPDNPGALLTQAQKNVSFALATSITQPPTSNTLALGMTALSPQQYSQFSSNFSSPGLPQGRLTTGWDAGTINLAVPGLSAYSRTTLATTAYTERFYSSVQEEISVGSNTTLSTSALLYAYRFPDTLSLSLQDGFERNFSLQGTARNGVAFDVDTLTPMGTIIPGMMFSAEARDTEDRWHVAYKRLPYVPLTVDSSMHVSIDNAQNNLLAMLDTFSWADDIQGGIAGSVLGQTTKLDMGKDVNGTFFLAPELTIAKKLSIGVKAQSQGLTSSDVLTYHSSLKTGLVDPTLFWEQNLSNLTDTYGLSLDRITANNAYNLSTGFTTWNNTGVTEVVEQYVSAGLKLNNRVWHRQGFAINDINQTQRWFTSSNLLLGKDGFNRLSLETGMTMGRERGVDAMVKSQFIF